MTWGSLGVWACFTDAMPAHVRKVTSFAGPGFGVILTAVGCWPSWFILQAYTDKRFQNGFHKKRLIYILSQICGTNLLQICESRIRNKFVLQICYLLVLISSQFVTNLLLFCNKHLRYK
jgi:hypothetical protein